MALIEKKYGFRIVIDFILLLIVAVPILLFYLIGSPFERGFFCDDSIWYPYKDSTISSLVLYFVGTLLPASMILILEYVRCRQEPVGKRTLMCGRTVPPYLWALYCNIGVFLFGCACSQLLTDVAKYSIGRLRPHFLEVCNPDWSKINCSVPGLYIYPECHPKDEFRLKEARLSFPSGHASFSAFTMVYLALYLQARMHIRIRLVRPALQFAAILIAFYTALSRVSDYKHHWSDVLFGSLLGTTVAFAVVYSVSGLMDGPRYSFSSTDNKVNSAPMSGGGAEMQHRRSPQLESV